MPLTHEQVFNLSNDGAFRARLAAAMVAYVPGVFTEPSTTPSHANRLSTANKVLNDPMGYATRLALGAAAALGPSMPDLNTPPDDATLNALVAQWWTLLADAPPVV